MEGDRSRDSKREMILIVFVDCVPRSISIWPQCMM